MKIRICKKSLAAFPAPVAARVASIAADYGLSSASFELKPEGYCYYLGEGDRVEVVYGQRVAAAQVVSESTLGAAGLCHSIGEAVAAPAGSFILVVHYYTRYFLSIYNIGNPALGG